MGKLYDIWAGVIRPKKPVKKEIKYVGTTAYIPELRMSIKLREGTTLEQWIINYCQNEPLAKRTLYPAYNIEDTGY